jgi:putative ABC transport system permease protein
VVGIFHSGSLFFDRCLVVPLAIARAIAGKGPELVSAYYAELEPGADAAAVARRVEARVPGTNAWTSDAVTEETAQVWDEVDLFLSAIASIAVLVGAVGIVNTMLMSVIERTGELGVLRATGWTRRDVVRLILVESAALGVLGGVLGCGLGAALVAVAGALLPLRPVVTPGLAAASFGLAVALGVLGGLYPAWRAARLDPIEAIRT